MDLTQSIEPRSDQINADDLIASPVTYTIREVIGGKAEQPFDFLLVETDRAYRPSKTMRRVIVNAWGPEAANYAGRRLTLYREPSIKFGGQTVGGIRISHMSHIENRVEVLAQVTRGKREKFVVEPLGDAPATAAPAASAPTPSPNTALLGEIRELAEQLSIDRKTIAAQWAADHDGQPISQATDLGGLELLRDDLAAQVRDAS
jgi:hypothetical protein